MKQQEQYFLQLYLLVRPNVDLKVCKIPYDENGPQYYCMINAKRYRCKGSDNKWIDCRDGKDLKEGSDFHCFFFQIFHRRFPSN